MCKGMVGEINGMRRDHKYISILALLEPYVHQESDGRGGVK